jgi:mycothiol synthase
VPDPNGPTAGGVEVVELSDVDAAPAAAVLSAAEHAVGAPLVDEGERVRLDALADAGVRADGWHPLVAHLGGEVVGYAAVVTGDGPGAAAGNEEPGTATGSAGPGAPAPGEAPSAAAVGEAAIAADVAPRAAVLTALLDRITDVATAAGAGHIQVWMRHVNDADRHAAGAAGFATERRLAILGHALPVTGPAPAPSAGVTVRASRPGEDDEAIVAVLAGAYADSAEAGWDLDRFRARRQLDWFRPEDLLVAEDVAAGSGGADLTAGWDRRDATAGSGSDGGLLLGLHWLKRRSPHVGEVYNLAVHPDGRGRGLGPVLLRAGLDHLADVDCDEVLLWVDRANDRAVRLYSSQGFVTRWEDVAFGRSLHGGASATSP